MRGSHEHHKPAHGDAAVDGRPIVKTPGVWDVGRPGTSEHRSDHQLPLSTPGRALGSLAVLRTGVAVGGETQRREP
jgi:hypothetical protein